MNEITDHDLAREVGWEIESISMYDEEGVEGWRWTEPDGTEHCEVGDWLEGPALPESAKEAIAALRNQVKEKTAQHTPGPWVVEYKATRRRDAVMACGEQWICTVGQSTIPTPEMAQANARLIAAAPDYHAATELVRTSAETLGTDMTYPERVTISVEAYDALTAAHAKAEGTPT